VTGLLEEEETEVEDMVTFLELCTAYLPVKTMLADGRCCTRIGKPLPGRPHWVLVRLHSEDATSDLQQQCRRFVSHRMNTFVQTF